MKRILTYQNYTFSSGSEHNQAFSSLKITDCITAQPKVYYNCHHSQNCTSPIQIAPVTVLQI